MRRLLVVSLLLIGASACINNKAEKITSSLSIAFLYNDSSFKYMPYVEVCNRITCTDFKSDTLKLSFQKLPHALSFIKDLDANFGIQNDFTFQVNNNKILKDSLLKIEYDKVAGKLHLIKNLANKLNFELTVKYSYKYDMDDYFTAMENAYMSINNRLINSKWYLYHENIEFTTLHVAKDSNIMFFCNAPLVCNNNLTQKYDISHAGNHKGDFFFSILNKKYYDVQDVKIKKSNFTLCLLKADSLAYDSLTNEIAISRHRQSSFLDSIKQSIVQKLSPLFDFYPDKTLNLSIIEAIWKNENEAYGQNMTGANEVGYIYCDSHFFKNSGITHEVLHSLCSVQANEKEFGHLFFNESIVETFTQYVLNRTNADSLNTAFEKTFEYYCNNYEDKQKSIFDIKENLSENMGIVYFKTPYTLYQFAKNNNSKEFWKALSSFMRLEIENASWQDFEAHFLQHGFSKLQMNELKERL